jgi:hypothetical protein
MTGRVLRAAGSILGAAALASCGSSTSGATASSTVVTTTTTPSTTTTSQPPASLGGNQTLSGMGVTLVATATSVIDPATAPSGAAGPGMRLVAVTLQVTNTSRVSISSDPDGDPTISATLSDSSGSSYPAEPFVTVTQCTSFVHSQINLHPGQSETGCLVFAIPAGAKPVSFQFSPTESFGSTGTWSIS